MFALVGPAVGKATFSNGVKVGCTVILSVIKRRSLKWLEGEELWGLGLGPIRDHTQKDILFWIGEATQELVITNYLGQGK